MSGTTTDATPLDGLIIGGGISGLAVAHWLGLHDHPGTWQLWEAAPHMGGTSGTDRIDGYSVDWGPNGFLDREPLTLQLVDDIGLRPELEPANDNSAARFIYKNGRLHPVPLSPPAILNTGLLTLGEKLRIFGEPFIRARRSDTDESVYDFAARRIGHGAAQTFVDPMVSGVFGGLAKSLSLPACFPIMREMEVKHGGLVRAMIARKRERKRMERAGEKSRAGGPAGPGGHLTSFHGGIDRLITRLAERHQSIIQTNRAAARIERISAGAPGAPPLPLGSVTIAINSPLWQVTDTQGRTILTRQIIIACPTYHAADFFRETNRDLALAFEAIPYAHIVVVATGHRREDIAHPLDGFGFLVPRNQGMRILGSIWTSSIFADRAPSGHVQFRTMLGGAGDPDVIDLPESDLWAIIRREIGPLLGIQADPVFMRVYRWPHGIPQFNLGHIERRKRIEHLLADQPGLHVVGNAYHGVGLNDCVKMAKRVADQIRADRKRAS